MKLIFGSFISSKMNVITQSNLLKQIIKNIYFCNSMKQILRFSTCLYYKTDLSILQNKTVNLNFISSFNCYLKTSAFLMKRRDELDANKTLYESNALEDTEYDSLFNETAGNMAGVSRIAVLQPWVKWGSAKRNNTNRDLLLDEACSLIDSLPSVFITYKEAVNLQSITRSHVFTRGTLERLVDIVKLHKAQAIFISVDYLNRAQRSALEESFGVKVLDRYLVVLGIFKHYATTVESKMQIAMAELPFMRKSKLTEVERLVLDRREARLKDALKHLSGRREQMRRQRAKTNLPSIAIVGYTNCGKTTLIRALTGDKSVLGANRLFATLDVTAHKVHLPCKISAILVDTVGFIQDIPTQLLASFNSTLADTVFADVIVHLRDISHPDINSQTSTVQDTLKSIDVPHSTSIITVNNKCDLIENDRVDDHLHISAISGKGLNELLYLIEAKILRVTKRKKYQMRLMTGSNEIRWLKKHAGILSMSVCPKDEQYTILIAIINEAQFSEYTKQFHSEC